jgi:hypothetical protein
MLTLRPLTLMWPWLTIWRAAARVFAKAEVIDDVVQPGFENLQHLLAGDAAALEGALIDAAELAFHQAVEIAQLLLLDQAQAVFGVLAAGLGSVNARAVIAAFQVFVRAEHRDAEAAADAGAGSSVTSHNLLDCGLRIVAEAMAGKIADCCDREFMSVADGIRRGVFCGGGSRCAERG